LPGATIKGVDIIEIITKVIRIRICDSYCLIKLAYLFYG